HLTTGEGRLTSLPQITFAHQHPVPVLMPLITFLEVLPEGKSDRHLRNGTRPNGQSLTHQGNARPQPDSAFEMIVDVHADFCDNSAECVFDTREVRHHFFGSNVGHLVHCMSQATEKGEPHSGISGTEGH